VRVHNLLTSGDGSASLKWGSTNIYSEDASGRPIYDWVILDQIFDTFMPPVSSRWSKSVSCPRRFLPTRSPIVTTFRGSAEIAAVANCLREMLTFPAIFFYPHSQSPREIGRKSRSLSSCSFTPAR
jgi:hypothetical protein